MEISWEKIFNECCKNVFLTVYRIINFIIEKSHIINRVALMSVIVIMAFTFLTKESRMLYRRYTRIRNDFMEFRLAYSRQMAELWESDNEPVAVIQDIRPPSPLEYEDSSEELVLQEDLSSSEWDFGADSDEYETDKEEFGIMGDADNEFTKAMLAHIRKQAKIARRREQIHIAETIEFDEYLLSKGLINNSEFGQTLMQEI